MRITIDATSLLLRSAGVKSYIYYWLRALRQTAGGGNIRAFPLLGKPGALDHDRSMLPPWATYPRLAVLYGVNFFPPALDWAIEGADIFHASNQVHHGPRKARLTATIHDLTCWKLPELHTAANVKADHRFAEQVLKKADGIIAVSEATREDAIDILGLPEERVVTIHSGVADAYFQVPAEQVLTVREDLNLTKPYVLCVGTIEPRKNLDRLLDAWLGMRADLREAFDLVVAGPAGWAGTQTVERLKATPGVRLAGYVPEPFLPALTAGALVFAYPSLYEGFGFPVAQAMAAGVPVLTSNISSLPEVTGRAAELVDPLSVNEIRAGLERLLESEDRREDLAIRAKEKAQSYRWERCARRSMTFFENVMGG